MKLTYNVIVKNLDATINHLSEKMISMHNSEGVVSEISAYSKIQDEFEYYKMLRKACNKRVPAEPVIEQMEEIEEFFAHDEIVFTDIYYADKILCKHCRLPLLDDNFISCPTCGKKIDWKPILYKDGLKIAYNDNGFLKKTKEYPMECANGACQLSLLGDDTNEE